MQDDGLDMPSTPHTTNNDGNSTNGFKEFGQKPLEVDSFMMSDNNRFDDHFEDANEDYDGYVQKPWRPSSTTSSVWNWTDFWYFCGPGWLVSIAYVDPGNYQADIQAGATTRYNLLFAVWWTSLLSIYVQILCVRLAYHGQLNLAQAQAREHDLYSNGNGKSLLWLRYFNWAVAEFSTILTDLPEVIGIGIACHAFFGWPYYVGVILSLLTTMVFLSTMHLGVHVLERIIFVFVGVMSIALWIEMAMVKPASKDIFQGWFLGFTEVQSSDIFSIAGILGAVVMPHNLYLHSAAVQARPVVRNDPQHPTAVEQAVLYCSWEPVVPIIVSFFVNMAVVAIAAEAVYGEPNAEKVGLTDFCNYFTSIEGGCILWGIALLAAGQSSAITTTYTGQYVMDGFLKLQLPVKWRAIITRLIAITPCVLVSILFPSNLNQMVNIVNASLSFLLPFALTPLVKFNCSPQIMGSHASTGNEKIVLHVFAVAVWAINAIALSVKGGGFLGDVRERNHANDASGFTKFACLVLELSIQIFYAWWNWNCLFATSSGSEEYLHSGNEYTQPLDEFQEALDDELYSDAHDENVDDDLHLHTTTTNEGGKYSDSEDDDNTDNKSNGESLLNGKSSEPVFT